MRTFVGMVLASSLIVSTAFAATDTGPLPTGKPAGIKQADIEAGGVLLVLGILGLAAGIAVVATAASNRGAATTTT